MISFVGAGPGAPDLLTLRGAERLAAADVVVWAGSLVPEAVLDRCRPGIERHDSSALTLEDVLAVYAAHPGAAIVRLHSGDPTVFSAVAEQVDWCVAHGRAFEIVPGVSAASAAAAVAGRELTVPGGAQSVVLTRLARRTAASVGAGTGGVADLARLGPTMAVFLSAADPEALRAELLAPGSAYDETTPVVVVHRATHPDERLIAATVGTLPAALVALGATTTVMVLVGDAVGPGAAPRRSHVYAPEHAHAFRPARPAP